MNNRMHTLFILVLVVCGLLSGCNETRFAALPDTALKPCDARWKGLWVPQDEPDGNGAFYVDERCHFVIYDHADNGGPVKRVPLRVRFAHIQDRDVMIVADTELKPLVDLDPVYGVKPVPKQAYFYTRYDMHKDRVAVYPVDSERVATRIIQRQLKGTVSKTAHELHVFVSGDGAKMRAILSGESIFADKPDFVLIRSKRPLSDFERIVGKPTGSKDG